MTTTQTVGTEALRLGYGSAVVLVHTADRNTAALAVKQWADNCPRYAGMTACIRRVTPRNNTYHTLGYDGPATSVTVSFTK